MIIYLNKFTSYEDYENYVWTEREEGRFSKLIEDGYIIEIKERNCIHKIPYSYRLLYDWEFEKNKKEV